MRTFRPNRERGHIFSPFKLFVVMVCAIWFGGQGTYTALKNRQPLTLTCAEASRSRPTAQWLVIKDCQIEVLDSAMLVEKPKDKPEKVTTAYLPLRPAGSSHPGTECRVVLATEDPAILGLINELRGATTHAELEFLKIKHAQALQRRRDVSGLVKTGSYENYRLGALQRFLSRDYIILAEGERPQLGLSMGILSVGLILLVYLVCRCFMGNGATEAES